MKSTNICCCSVMDIWELVILSYPAFISLNIPIIKKVPKTAFIKISPTPIARILSTQRGSGIQEVIICPRACKQAVGIKSPAHPQMPCLIALLVESRYLEIRAGLLVGWLALPSAQISSCDLCNSSTPFYQHPTLPVLTLPTHVSVLSSVITD